MMSVDRVRNLARWRRRSIMHPSARLGSSGRLARCRATGATTAKWDWRLIRTSIIATSARGATARLSLASYPAGPTLEKPLWTSIWRVAMSSRTGHSSKPCSAVVPVSSSSVGDLWGGRNPGRSATLTTANCRRVGPGSIARTMAPTVGWESRGTGEGTVIERS